MMNGAGPNGLGPLSLEVAGGQRSMSVDYEHIDNLTSQTDNEQELYFKEITHKHWKATESATCCRNRSCRKQFTLFERCHHCRRCGDIFCASCLKYKRKLNQLAHLDPQGRAYKVCKNCYEEGQSYDGCVRDLTTEFIRIREHKSSANKVKGKPRRGGGWRSRLNFDLECQRLIEGFRKSIGKSEVRCTLHELKSMVSLADWQKSSFWLQESTAGSCQICCEGFGFLRKRHFCRICGLALCKSCSTTDLLVYIPDDELHKESTGSVDTKGADPCLAIIKIIGCPEVEPEVSLYLCVCSECKEKMIERQVKRASEDEVPSGLDMLNELAALDMKFSEAESHVNKQLKEYQEIIQSLEDNSRTTNDLTCASSSGTGSTPHSNMRTLAKAQEDLTDFLACHVLVVHRLKRLVPKTETESHLLKNYIRAKCDFYLENMSIFRKQKAKLGESSPPEVLEFIQRAIDKNAIISAHLYLRQLVFEVIYLCNKYKLQEKALQLLVNVEQVAEQDVAACLKKEGEDLDQHLELLKEMIRTQMKEHKLIKTSRRALSRHGKTHVQQVMGVRMQEILVQVTLQLKLKSANRSFQATKQALGKVRETLVTT